jgi:hypothetical protein
MVSFQPSPAFLARQKRLEGAVNLIQSDQFFIAPEALNFCTGKSNGNNFSRKNK